MTTTLSSSLSLSLSCSSPPATYMCHCSPLSTEERPRPRRRCCACIPSSHSLPSSPISYLDSWLSQVEFTRQRSNYPRSAPTPLTRSAGVRCRNEA
ncbi:hypothetical protein GALMADRAFT_454500 [Galerina marginata CBS 339.88]|uniref:Uncharacterized protein n=1 Tax=Galerina marginata (strain CBS 339.88) TaxID=685588 RepID=A0A067T0X2_GALM3|nr:hypothetical protein GALMADRAFT_454500 [Galerina marginata CBS 339.88]